MARIMQTGGDKMKHKIIAIMLLLVFSSMVLVACSNNEVESFSKDDYLEEIANYSITGNIGEISSASEAKKAAEEFFDEEYDSSTVKMKPYTVYRDEENDLWLIIASSLGVKEAGAHLIVKSNGDLVARWAYKA